MAIDLAGRKARARKIRPVRCVRPDMRLQAYGVRLPVELAALARDRAVEIVAGIDLEAGLIGEQLHDAHRARRLHTRRERKLAVARETVGMVVTPAVAQLLVALADALADGPRLAEVERRAGNAAPRLRQRNGRGINREEMPGGDRQL